MDTSLRNAERLYTANPSDQANREALCPTCGHDKNLYGNCSMSGGGHFLDKLPCKCGDLHCGETMRHNMPWVQERLGPPWQDKWT